MLSTRLRQLRTECGLSIQEISNQTGVPVSTYRSWEEGVRIVGEEPYLKLCSAFSISLHELITGNKEESPSMYQDNKILREKLNSVKSIISEIEKVITL